MRATQQDQGSVISNKEVDASPSDWWLPGEQALTDASVMGGERAHAEPSSLLALAACCVY